METWPQIRTTQKSDIKGLRDIVVLSMWSWTIWTRELQPKSGLSDEQERMDVGVGSREIPVPFFLSPNCLFNSCFVGTLFGPWPPSYIYSSLLRLSIYSLSPSINMVELFFS